VRGRFIEIPNEIKGLSEKNSSNYSSKFLQTYALERTTIANGPSFVCVDTRRVRKVKIQRS